MRIQNVVDAVESTLIDEEVPVDVRELILDHVADILRDEVGDEDD